METVGDKYMAVSGLPEYEVAHARHISLLALEMMDLSQTVTVDGEPVVSTLKYHENILMNSCMYTIFATVIKGLSFVYFFQ